MASQVLRATHAVLPEHCLAQRREAGDIREHTHGVVAVVRDAFTTTRSSSKAKHTMTPPLQTPHWTDPHSRLTLSLQARGTPEQAVYMPLTPRWI